MLFAILVGKATGLRSLKNRDVISTEKILDIRK